MSDEKHQVPDTKDEPRSTTDEVLHLLREQASFAKGDDALNNPELDQLFGKLSMGVKGDPENGAGEEPQSLLTLEEIALGAGALTQPVFVAVACTNCGSANAKLARFCGMCGHELRPKVVPPALPADTEQRPAIPQIPAEVLARSILPKTGRDSGRVWKIGCLVLLCVVLGLIANQQHWWQLLSWQRSSTSATTPTATAGPVTQTAGTEPGQPVAAKVQQDVPNVQTLNTSVKPPKAAPPTATKVVLPREGRPSKPAKPALAEKPVAVSRPAANTLVDGQQEADLILPPSVSSVAASDPTVSAAQLPELRPSPANVAAATPPARVSQVTEGALIHKVAPVFPAAARSAHVNGSVTMHATIGKDGTVQKVQVLKGNPLLVRAATDAVKQWRYRPYFLDGQPVETETNITINFKGE